MANDSFTARRAVSLLVKIRDSVCEALKVFESGTFLGPLAKALTVTPEEVNAAVSYLVELGLCHEEARQLRCEYDRSWADGGYLQSLMRNPPVALNYRASEDDPDDPEVARAKQVNAERLADHQRETDDQRGIAIDAFSALLKRVEDLAEAVEREFPAVEPLSGHKTPTKSITRDEAEAVARRLDKDDVTFRHLRAEDMAKRIEQESGKPCSETLVKGLPFWNEAMTATGRGRKRRGARGHGRKRGTAARPMNFSKEVEAVTGEGEKHEVLEDLAEAEENAEAERALREQRQAIHRVESSRLNPEEKCHTIARLEAGEMTPRQAVNMVSELEQDPKRNRKKALSRD